MAASTASSPPLVTARSIHAAICAISGSRMPRVVTAGVPRRMPLVCIGGRVIGIELTKVVLESFLNANFLPEPRFQRRLDKLNQVEQNGLP